MRICRLKRGLYRWILAGYVAEGHIEGLPTQGRRRNSKSVSETDRRLSEPKIFDPRFVVEL